MSDIAQILTFGVDRERFGIAIGQVREILDMQPVSRLPHAPDFLLGLIDVRGTSVPVVDLRTKLGLPKVATTDFTRIIIVDVPRAGRVLGVGLVADCVYEVASLETSTLEAPPEVGAVWNRRCIAGIGRRAGAFVIILDVSSLMEGDEAALEASGEPVGA